jgi:hypothetical protein
MIGMRSERGYVGVRLLVLLGVVASLVWVIPFVFMSSEKGRSPEQGAGSVEDAAGPTADLPADVPAVTGGDVVTDPIGAAQDLQAQSIMNQAIRSAQVYYAENGTFQGFDPDVAAGYDPSVAYTEGAPAPNVVSMTVTPTTVVLVTIEQGGDPLCAAAMGDIVTFGRLDTTSPAECQGGWK